MPRGKKRPVRHQAAQPRCPERWPPAAVASGDDHCSVIKQKGMIIARHWIDEPAQERGEGKTTQDEGPGSQLGFLTLGRWIFKIHGTRKIIVCLGGQERLSSSKAHVNSPSH